MNDNARIDAGAGPDADGPSDWVRRWLPEANGAGRVLDFAWRQNGGIGCWRWTAIRPVWC